jgi:hypothetical protein
MSSGVPFQDPSISDRDYLLRRIQPIEIKPDGRIARTAFKDVDLSVNLERLTTIHNTMSSVSMRSNFNQWGLIRLQAGIPRKQQLYVYRQPSKSNKSHSVIYGDKPEEIQDALVEASERIDWLPLY